MRTIASGMRDPLRRPGEDEHGVVGRDRPCSAGARLTTPVIEPPATALAGLSAAATAGGRPPVRGLGRGAAGLLGDRAVGRTDGRRAVEVLGGLREVAAV